MANENFIEYLIKGDVSGAIKSFSDVEGAMASVSKMLAGLGVAFSAVKFVEFIGKQIDVADEFSKMSIRTGVAIDTLSQLDHAFNLAGLSSDDMETSFKFLNKSIDEAVQGNDAARISFNSLGLSLDDIKGKSPDKVMLLMADAFTKIEDPVARNTMLLEKFGKAGVKLGPAFAEGSVGIQKLMDEAKRLGLTVDAEFGRNAEKFNDNMTRIGEMSAGAGRSIAKMLLPILNDTVEALFDFGKTGDESILPWGKIFVNVVGSVAVVLLGFKSTVVTVATLITSQWKIVGMLFTAVGEAIRKSLEGDFSGAAQTMAEAWDQSKQVASDALTKIDKELNTTATAINKIADYADNYGQSIKSAGEETKEAGKYSLHPISKQAAAELETFRIKQQSFIDGMMKNNATASQNKMALLDAEYTHQKNLMNEMRFKGAELVKAQNAMDQWYASARIAIQEEMLAKLGVTDQTYRDMMLARTKVDAERMVQAGLTQIQADRYTKNTLLQQQIDLNQAKLDQQDIIYATDNEKADIQDQINADRLLMALDRDLITKQQHTDALEQMELAKQARLGSIHAQGELNRLLVSKMTFGQQLAFTSQSLDSITGLMQTQSKEGFRIGKAAAIAQAVINTYTAATGAYASASSIPIVGWILGPIAAIAAIALGMANVSKIRSQQMGQAHAGMTNVPNEGTFLLSKGERVIQPEQNKDLTNFLDQNGGSGKSSGVQVGSITVNITVPNGEGLRTMTRREWEDIVADRVIPALNVLDRKGVRPDSNQRLAR